MLGLGQAVKVLLVEVRVGLGLKAVCVVLVTPLLVLSVLGQAVRACSVRSRHLESRQSR